MHSNIFEALFTLLAVSGAYGTPMEDLFEKLHEKPMRLYQCFRNATTFEDMSATGLTGLWSGVGQPDNEAICHVSYSEPGSHGKTKFDVNTKYLPENDNAILTGAGISVQLWLSRPPYDGKAYYFQQVVTSTGEFATKIYDTSSSCKNAKALLKQVCPEPCNLEPARQDAST